MKLSNKSKKERHSRPVLDDYDRHLWYLEEFMKVGDIPLEQQFRKEGDACAITAIKEFCLDMNRSSERKE